MNTDEVLEEAELGTQVEDSMVVPGIDPSQIEVLPAGRRRGRARSDGLPNKTATPTAKTPDINTPSPPYTKYWSEAPNYKQKPQELFNWIVELPTWVKDRLTLYIYRTWPILVAVEKDPDTGRPVDSINIDKIAGNTPITSSMMLQDKYGSGDYQIWVNDDVHDKRNLCKVYIRENFRDLRAYPPTDQKIDDVANVDLQDPGNRSYVQYLKSKGKLPEQQMSREREADMAEATAVTQMTGMMGRMMDKALDSKGGSGNSEEGMKVIANAAMKGQEIIAESVKRADQMRTEMPDPLVSVERVMGLVEKFRPKEGAPGSDSGMVQVFMAQIMEMNKTIQSIQNERIKTAEDRVKEMENRAATPTTVPAGGLDQVLSDVDKFNKLKELFGGGGDGGGGGKSSWMDMLPSLMSGFNTLISNGIVGYQSYVMAQNMRQNAANAAQGQPGAPMPPMPQPVAQPQPRDDDEEPQNGQGAAPGLPPGHQEPQDEGAQLVWFLSTIERPFAKAFADGRGGVAFAETLIEDIHDRSTYDWIREQGAENMKMALKSFPPINRHLIGKDSQLDKFVKEFLEAGDILDQPEPEEEDQPA